MPRKREDIRNEGIEGALPTTGSTPSITAKGGLATNTDEARNVGWNKMLLLVYPGLLHMSAKFGAN
jgi:hypothetical protein